MFIEPACLPFKPDATLLDFQSRHPGLQTHFDALDRKHRSGAKWRGVPRQDRQTVGQHVRTLYAATQLYPAKKHGLNKSHMGLLAWGHELGETMVPDWTPHDNISPQEKFRREHLAVSFISGQLGPEGKEVLNLWLEYESRKTRESNIVFELDQMAGFVECIHYHHIGGHRIDDYMNHMEKHAKDPVVIRAFNAVTNSIGSKADPYEVYVKCLKAERTDTPKLDFQSRPAPTGIVSAQI